MKVSLVPNLEILVGMSEDIGHIKSSVESLVETTRSTSLKVDAIHSRLTKVEGHQAWVKTVLSVLTLPLTFAVKLINRGI